jgi:hypothetical protein
VTTDGNRVSNTTNPDQTKDNTDPNINPDNTNENNPTQKIDPLTKDLEPIEKDTKKVVAVTLKPVVDAYCDAMRKKDNAALRKVFTQQTIKALEASVKKEGLKSIYEYLEIEPVGAKCEVVNETINGNSAEAMVITETYPTGTKFIFENENGQWKMTRKSADLENVDNQ